MQYSSLNRFFGCPFLPHRFCQSTWLARSRPSPCLPSRLIVRASSEPLSDSNLSFPLRSPDSGQGNNRSTVVSVELEPVRLTQNTPLFLLHRSGQNEIFSISCRVYHAIMSNGHSAFGIIGSGINISLCKKSKLFWSKNLISIPDIRRSKWD